jgi:hypothetical protein
MPCSAGAPAIASNGTTSRGASRRRMASSRASTVRMRDELLNETLFSISARPAAHRRLGRRLQYDEASFLAWLSDAGGPRRQTYCARRRNNRRGSSRRWMKLQWQVKNCPSNHGTPGVPPDHCFFVSFFFGTDPRSGTALLSLASRKRNSCSLFLICLRTLSASEGCRGIYTLTLAAHKCDA